MSARCLHSENKKVRNFFVVVVVFDKIAHKKSLKTFGESEFDISRTQNFAFGYHHIKDVSSIEIPLISVGALQLSSEI